MSDETWDNDWLIFSRKSRRGAFVLIVFFILVAVAPRIYRNYFLTESLDPKIKSISLSETSENKDRRRGESPGKSNSTSIAKKGEDKSGFQYNIPANSFNPNDYSFEDWQSIGFSDKQVQSILNYTEKVGDFKVKSDVKKLFVVDDDLFAQLESKIDLPDSIPVSKEDNSFTTEESTEIEIVNINTADIEGLSKIPGVGAFFAKEIVKTRDSYGGIHDSRQLLTIYKMDEEKLSEIEQYIEINSRDVKKLNINSASKEELIKHKDITWDIANSIVYIREKRGLYKKLDDLLMSPFIDQEKLKLLKPYLTID